MNENNIIQHLANIIDKEKHNCLEQADRNFPEGKSNTFSQSKCTVNGAYKMAVELATEPKIISALCDMALEFIDWTIETKSLT